MRTFIFVLLFKLATPDSYSPHNKFYAAFNFYVLRFDQETGTNTVKIGVFDNETKTKLYYRLFTFNFVLKSADSETALRFDRTLLLVLFGQMRLLDPQLLEPELVEIERNGTVQTVDTYGVRLSIKPDSFSHRLATVVGVDPSENTMFASPITEILNDEKDVENLLKLLFALEHKTGLFFPGLPRSTGYIKYNVLQPIEQCEKELVFTKETQDAVEVRILLLKVVQNRLILDYSVGSLVGSLAAVLDRPAEEAAGSPLQKRLVGVVLGEDLSQNTFFGKVDFALLGVVLERAALTGTVDRAGIFANIGLVGFRDSSVDKEALFERLRFLDKLECSDLLVQKQNLLFETRTAQDDLADLVNKTLALENELPQVADRISVLRVALQEPTAAAQLATLQQETDAFRSEVEAIVVEPKQSEETLVLEEKLHELVQKNKKLCTQKNQLETSLKQANKNVWINTVILSVAVLVLVLFVFSRKNSAGKLATDKEPLKGTAVKLDELN